MAMPPVAPPAPPPVPTPATSNPPPPALERPRRSRHRAVLILGLVAAGAVTGSVWWFAHRSATSTDRAGARPTSEGRSASGPGGRSAPLPVGVVPAQRGDIALYVDGLGTVTPLHTVTVRTQISGQLMQLAFQEGQLVHQGDLLAVIDARPYENVLTQAEGERRQAEAQLKKAQLDLERYQKLAQQDSIARQQVDTAQAQVTQFEGLVQTSQAAIDTAKLNIAYCHITAPVEGRVGLRKVDVGNYVTPGDANGIVVLTQVKPITVLFTLPEDNLAPIVARLRAGAKLAVDAFDRAQSNRLATGTLSTIDNQFDPTTGTFKLRAEFANDDESLFPNQFVNVRLLVDTLRNVVVIPTSAVEHGQQGTFVYVAQPDNTVAVRPVTLGPTEGEHVAVTAGLAVGDRVVVDGADRLRDGMQVIVAGEPTQPHTPPGNGPRQKNNS